MVIMTLELVNIEVVKIDNIENSIQWLGEVAIIYLDRQRHKCF